VNLVSRFELILLLMAVVIGLELLARRARLPPAAAFIQDGIVLAFIPGLPDIELDPDLALVLFLPPSLLSSAYFTGWRDFRANLRIILQLAVGAVAFTTGHGVREWRPESRPKRCPGPLVDSADARPLRLLPRPVDARLSGPGSSGRRVGPGGDIPLGLQGAATPAKPETVRVLLRPQRFDHC
jgi:hypothetical protein